MAVNRRFLYVGLFLVAIGGVLVAADLSAVTTATLADALRLWPLAIIAFGAALVLRRSSISLPAGMLAAALPGLVLGGAFAIAPRYAGDCGVRGGPASTATQQGTFEAPARVSVVTGCGSITVHTAPGNGWQLTTGNSAGRTPSVSASFDALSINSVGDEGWQALSGGRDMWDLALPAGDIDSVSMVVNAGHGSINLAGAQIARLAVTANASEIVLDASGGSVGNLSGTVNLGLLSIHLPAGGDLVASLRVGAGALQVCTPPGLGLRVTSTGTAREVAVEGLRQTGSVWQSPDYLTAAHRADVSVRVNFGTVQINPIGGCR